MTSRVASIPASSDLRWRRGDVVGDAAATAHRVGPRASGAQAFVAGANNCLLKRCCLFASLAGVKKQEGKKKDDSFTRPL